MNFVQKFSYWRSRVGVYAALAVLLIVCMASNGAFRNPQNLVNITRQVSYSGLVALGMTFVIAAGGIDLSVGSLVALAGVAGLRAMNAVPGSTGLALAAGLLAALAAGLAGGAVNGILIGGLRIQPFIVTLGTMSVYRSLALFWADAGLVPLTRETCAGFASGNWLGVPLPTWGMVLAAALLSVLLTRTPFGRHVAATGSNEKVARYAAVPTGRVRFFTYLVTGSLSGLAAFLLAGRLDSVSSTGAGLNYELDAIASVIIGGTAMTGGRATVWGTLAGALLLGIVSNILDMWGISVNLQGTVKGLVIIIAVLLQYKRTPQFIQ